ncbi:MAG: hypothetical protein EOM23_08690, partial [Candidatus Moranbacteria bacterium]|nr:hypothetical protein [Candidatus Moranbacteria bacterium]
MNYNKVITIDEHWLPDEIYDGVYPKGARSKSAYFSDVLPEFPFIKPGRRYLFKEAFRRHPYQFWMEIIAYRIGLLMNIEVPPTYIGYIKETDTYGALIEWFYTDKEGYIDGGNILEDVISDYDRKKGEKHNWKTIENIIIKLIPDAKLQRQMFSHWAKIFVFDTVIGNTDRHHDNWGVIQKRTFKNFSNFSPAFDNGTSLGYEQIEANLGKFEDDAYLMRYITKPGKARHHMRWSLTDNTPLNFFDFMIKFMQRFPETHDTVLRCLDINIS